MLRKGKRFLIKLRKKGSDFCGYTESCLKNQGFHRGKREKNLNGMKYVDQV